MDHPRISLVTPSLNAAATLERSITSVLGQRYPRLDYILIDGGSQDGSTELLRRYRRFFSHTDTAPGETRAGLAARGFARASGDIMAWLDDGVVLAPGTLDFVAWFFGAHPRIDLIYGHRLVIDSEDRAVAYEILPRLPARGIRRHPLLPIETCFWRRSLYERSGGVDPRFTGAAAYDLQVRLLTAGRVHRVDRFLAATRNPGPAPDGEFADPLFEAEVRHIQRVHGMRQFPWSHLAELRLRRAARWRGARFARREECRPGNLPGLGWSYDRLWGGTLHVPRENGI
jgi:glycosyltransferase involved in cell wall biosynthesis